MKSTKRRRSKKQQFTITLLVILCLTFGIVKGYPFIKDYIKETDWQNDNSNKSPMGDSLNTDNIDSVIINKSDENPPLNDSDLIDESESNEDDKIPTMATEKSTLPPPSLSAESYLLLDLNHNTIITEKDSKTQLFPASTTKIMTALLALEHGNLQDEVVIPPLTGCYPEQSKIAYLNVGDVLTLEQLLNALLIYSANDSAAAIAIHIGGSQEEFARMMNERAKELGALNTHFVNPHGLHDENHYTTAYDLSLIAREALKYDKFIEIIGTPSYEAVFKNKDEQTVVRDWKSTNKFFTSNRDGIEQYIVGGKTGFTNQAGYNLVSYIEYEGKKYISVVLKDTLENLYEDTKSLVAFGIEYNSENE